jgi:hypothetical protein
MYLSWSPAPHVGALLKLVIAVLDGEGLGDSGVRRTERRMQGQGRCYASAPVFLDDDEGARGIGRRPRHHVHLYSPPIPSSCCFGARRHSADTMAAGVPVARKAAKNLWRRCGQNSLPWKKTTTWLHGGKISQQPGRIYCTDKRAINKRSTI